nr:immunoglobulin heavy chain junction region [Macaca mulatta]MOW20133.1 immunoglobulin heavy chain junction region [Macaca mulatta]MOW20654.1 immunoglobulin heavy chain junction region [Macaca mulatta]MOW20743.1 immunoglobulin heavy chain junction region [Macaca mulatta]MOW20998.1 immunoglobulin heavy chain junction region [Macaca mulatta]
CARDRTDAYYNGGFDYW